MVVADYLERVSSQKPDTGVLGEDLRRAVETFLVSRGILPTFVGYRIPADGEWDYWDAMTQEGISVKFSAKESDCGKA